ncbi:VapE domain-containing protein [Serratia marcescens]|uniref:VapE domain-containing protein n=1 Tax=Serratia marcescens TaxID=615 RepID=UPI000667A025|nr:VapE domain-containing protein [Serratia marcescens]
MQKNNGATPDEWTRAAALFGASNLIPIAPEGELSPASHLDPKDVGKVPSVYNGAGKIAGFKDWTSHEAAPAEIEKWGRRGYNIGLILGRDRGDGTALCAVDVDTAVSDYQDSVYDLLVRATNMTLPYRGRDNSERRAYILRAPADVMARRAHILPEENGKKAAVEFLAKGQQVVIHGQHPSKGRYQWIDNPMIGMPHELQASDIPTLTAEQFAELWAAIAKELPVTDSTVARAGRQRDLSEIDPSATDDVADYLDANGWTISVSADGSRNLLPFRDESEYSNGCSETSIKYFPAGTGGFQQGHFVSLHATDTGLTDADWLDGYGVRDNDFDVIPAEGGEEYLPLPAFSRDKNGQIEGTITNVLLALRRPDLCGVQIRLDEFRNEVILTTPRGEHLLLRDEYYTKIHETLERNLQFKKFQETEIKRSVRLIAYENRYDSLKDWLSQLPAWDGVPRIDTFFCRHWGIESSAYSKAVGRYWWTLLAGRALEPGIKGDMAVVLVSQQGKNKSEGIRAMAPTPEHYMELDFEKPAAERVREMRGHNVIELGEMRGMNKAGIGAVRVTISTRADRNRGLYREHYDTLPRRCGFIATVNTDTPLTDTEGNRRWLPMTIPDDIDGKHIAAQIATEREQLWAEAVLVFKAEGIAWERAETLAKTVLGDYEVKNEVWTACVAEWLEAESTELNDSTLVKNCDRVPLTSKDLLVEAIGFKASQVKRGNEMDIAKVMKDLGYKKVRLQSEPGRPYHWQKRG